MKLAVLAVAAALMLVGPAAAQTNPNTLPEQCRTDPRPPCINAPVIVNGPTPGTTEEIGPSSRSQNFWTGSLKDGQFDISTAQLQYVNSDVDLGVLGDVFGEPPNPGDALFGGLAAGAFSVYKLIVDATLQLVGSIVFGLIFVSFLLDPALRLAEKFQSVVIGPLELWKIVMACCGIYFVWAIYMLRKPGAAIMDLIGSGAAIAAMVMFFPSQVIRWLVSLVVGAAAIIFAAATGANPRSVPGPSSTASISTERLTDSYHGFIGKLEKIMIGDVAEVLTFSGKLPDACRGAYRQAKSQHLGASDEKFFEPFKDIAECKPYVVAAMNPDPDRLVYAGLLGLYSLAFAAILILIAWPTLKGTVQLMIFAATSKFLFLAAALPGPARQGAVRLIFGLLYGVASFVLLSLVLVMILLFQTAIFAATDQWPMFPRLVLILAVPVAFLFVVWKANKHAKLRAQQAAKNVTNTRQSVQAGKELPRSRVQQTFENKARRIVRERHAERRIDKRAEKRTDEREAERKRVEERKKKAEERKKAEGKDGKPNVKPEGKRQAQTVPPHRAQRPESKSEQKTGWRGAARQTGEKMHDHADRHFRRHHRIAERDADSTAVEQLRPTSATSERVPKRPTPKPAPTRPAPSREDAEIDARALELRRRRERKVRS